MKGPESITTERLTLDTLIIEDVEFILELVNTEGWLRFIGDRNIRSMADAGEYVSNLIHNKNVTYWVVRVKETLDSVGVVTIIQKDYLEHPDIGFAFLPDFSKQGYALEASDAVLHALANMPDYSSFLACTIPENISSIRLLERLGFHYRDAIEVGENHLSVYQISCTEIKQRSELIN